MEPFHARHVCIEIEHTTVVLVWSNFLASVLTMREIPPFLFTALRFALLALLALPLVWLVKRPTPWQWPRLLAVACASACCTSD